MALSPRFVRTDTTPGIIFEFALPEDACGKNQNGTMFRFDPNQSFVGAVI
jgi:hypothetical protein